MQFNDTTNRQGIIQDIEHWTNLGDGVVSGDAALLKNFTRLVNLRYSKVFGKLQNLSGIDGAEDTNYSSQQFSTFDIVSGQSSYEFLVDEDGNTITDITGVHLIPSGGTDYMPLKKVLLSDPRAQLVMSPNASHTGTPAQYIEKNNVVYFDYIPDYDGAASGKLFYRLAPSFFASTDTTKEPGFVSDFDRILPLGASLDWLLVNKPDNQVLITRVEGELKEQQNDLETYIRQKNPTRAQMTGAVHSTR